MAAAPSEQQPLVTAICEWFDDNARELPWRRPNTPPWHVLVSEMMLQQTPVSRVLPSYQQWLDRWPTPADLAADSPGEAVRMWGKLGYPRRALRLHACAVAIDSEHGGLVPGTLPELLALPGVGQYTARAVLAFAYRRRAAVVDTNVRRVLARAVQGTAQAGPVSTTRDLVAMEQVLPVDDDAAARFCASIMELGAVICRAGTPRCLQCPIQDQCHWRAAGHPAWDGTVPRAQRFEGTDRQVRGRLMDVVRAAALPVPRATLDISWPDPYQRDRALAALISDGLIEQTSANEFCLPR